MKLPLSITSPTPMACAVASPRTTLPSISAAIGEIEQKISHHAQIIIDLKIERNSLLPISQLPVEVLCKIFKCAQQSYHTDKDPTASHQPERPWSWMAVTHVCHYWRNAALNEPSLWTEPVLKHEMWTFVFLERSRMAGVTLSFVELVDSRPLGLIFIVVPHVPHTTTLVMQGMKRTAMNMVFKHLSLTPAPMLTTLVIDGTTAFQDTSIWRNPGDDRYTSVRLPKKAFANAPMLRRLSLNYIDLSWNSHLISGLTDLKLENIPENARPTPQELLLVLGRNLALRSLTLRSALPTTGSLAAFTSHNRRRIPLRALEVLDIASEAPACEFLCSHIASSGALKKINLDLQCGITQSGQVCRILSALDEADIPLGSNIRDVTLTGNIVDHLRPAYYLTLHTNSLDDSFNSHDDTSTVLDANESPLDLQMQMSTVEAAHNPDFFSDFFQTLHWDNLAVLDIQDLEIHRAVFHVYLAASFGTLPRLRAVSVGKSSVNCLIGALLLNWDKDPAVHHGSVSFPGLQHIAFNDINFGAILVKGMAVKVDRLVDCLMNRCERNVPIHSILMKKCMVFGMVDRRFLEEVVVDIHWDGSAVHNYNPHDLVDLT